MLRGPGGFSGEVKLLRRELVTGADGSGVRSFADFFCGMLLLRLGVEGGERDQTWQATCSIRGGKLLLF